MSDKINDEVFCAFMKKFNCGLGYSECYNGSIRCYDVSKTGKSYFVKSLTDEQIEALMKKSLASGHDYLLDAVKDNECPPYDPDCIY